MDELTIGDKIYISSKRAAEITGYAKDYVGQLCREGRVEATLVGRSWYVLETSIRAHRFGSEDQSQPHPNSNLDAANQKATVSTWDTPKYVPEEIVEVPQIEKKPINLIESAPEPAPEPVQRVEATVEDMQTAWREWFATRNREKLIESPEVIDARAAEEPAEQPDKQGEEPEQSDGSEYEAAADQTETVQIRRVVEKQPIEVRDPIPSTPEIEEPVMIRKQKSMPYVAPAEPAYRTRSRSKGRKGSYLAVRALLVSLALIAAAVAVIGTGNAEAFLGTEARMYEPVKFLGGTRTIE